MGGSTYNIIVCSLYVIPHSYIVLWFVYFSEESGDCGELFDFSLILQICYCISFAVGVIFFSSVAIAIAAVINNSCVENTSGYLLMIIIPLLIFATILGYAIMISIFPICQDLGHFLGIQASTVYSCCFIWIFRPIEHYLKQIYTHAHDEEEYNGFNLDKKNIIILGIIIIAIIVFDVVLDIFTSDVIYYGENCINFLNFCSYISYFGDLNQIFEGVIFLSVLASNFKCAKILLIIWALILFFSFWVFGVVYLMMLAQGEDCGDLGYLFLSTFSFDVIFFPPAYVYFLNASFTVPFVKELFGIKEVCNHNWR